MTKAGNPDHSDLYQQLRNGDRTALGRAITLVESTHPGHQAAANAVLDACLLEAHSRLAMRLAVSGTPGVGKSTFVESIGTEILDAGLSLAVLAIDPSSHITGGSILADKTRMQHLASHHKAFIRPSPAGTHSGGVAGRTREAVALCEAAGYDVIIVETVGVGQSEFQVRSMVDVLALLITPGGGDEVQGIKRGILEVADVVVINKADGQMIRQARETQTQYIQALRMLHMQDTMPEVLTCSALQGFHIQEVWQVLKARFEHMRDSSQLQALRNAQNLEWFEQRLREDALQIVLAHPSIIAALEEYRMGIAKQEISVRSALTALHHKMAEVLVLHSQKS